MKKKPERAVVFWKIGIRATILTIILMIIMVVVAGAENNRVNKSATNDCRLRILYGGGLRSSIAPCG